MSYVLDIIRKGHYLHTRVTGNNSPENVLGYLQEVTDRSREEDCPYLLIEEQLDGPRQDMAAVFEIASRANPMPDFAYLAVAYVDVNAKGDLMDFTETVAVNRSIPIKVFRSVSQAEDWLNKGC